MKKVLTFVAFIIGMVAFSTTANASSVSEAFPIRSNVNVSEASEACYNANNYNVSASFDGTYCVLSGTHEALQMLGDTLFEGYFSDYFMTQPELSVIPPVPNFCQQGKDSWKIDPWKLAFLMESARCTLPLGGEWSLSLFMENIGNPHARCMDMGGSFETIGTKGSWLYLMVCWDVDF